MATVSSSGATLPRARGRCGPGGYGCFRHDGDRWNLRWNTAVQHPPGRPWFALDTRSGPLYRHAVLDQPEKPILNVVGDKVALGPLRRELLPLYQRWINDFSVLEWLGSAGLRPMTAEAETAWYERVSTNETSVSFTIYESETNRPIGNTGLHQIDHFNRTAVFGIVIGEKDCWGKGYGTEATRLILEYAFNGLGLHNVMLSVFPRNERAIKAYNARGLPRNRPMARSASPRWSTGGCAAHGMPGD